MAADGITDDGIARLRLRVGHTATSQISGRIPFNTVGTIDAFRHFAHGYGDDNPLYCDPAYASATVFAEPIAPPTFLSTIGTVRGPKVPPEVAKQSAGALGNVQAFQAGGEWEFYEPVREGDRLETANFITDVEDKTSSFGGGRSAIVHHRQVWWRADDHAVIGQYHVWYVNTERTKSERSAKAPIVEPTYDEEALEVIDAAYAAERRRGASAFVLEDLAVGDVVDPIVKGPLTVTDMISFHMGWGWSGQGTFASRLGWQHRKKRPDLWNRNIYGAPDIVQRGHWDPLMANKVGASRPYDYGFLRTCWFVHAVTNWMGDDAWLYRIVDRTSSFNFVGDATWITGEVIAVDEAMGMVSVQLSATNQDGLVTATATGDVLLSSPGGAGHGVARAVVPESVSDLVQRALDD